MCKRRNVLWVEREETYVRTLARSLRVHARPAIDLRVRFVDDPRAVWQELPEADVLIANPSILGAAYDDLFARWCRDKRGPAIAFAAHFTTRQCVRLQRLQALVVTKDGALEEAPELAQIIAEGFCPNRTSRPPEDTTEYDALLAELAARGSSYARFAHGLEVHAIRCALDREHSVRRAAESLGMKRSTVVSKIAKLGLGEIHRTL